MPSGRITKRAARSGRENVQLGEIVWVVRKGIEARPPFLFGRYIE